MGDFSREFGRSSERPPCYSDPDEYDPDDHVCIECQFKGPCSVISAKKDRERRRKSSSSSSSSKTYSKKEKQGVNGKINPDSFTVEEPDENDSFSSAVLHNVSLNAVQAFTSTLDDAVSNIPRKGYTNLWNRKKKKKES